MDIRNILINIGRYIPDKLYLKLVYRFKVGKPLNLKNPVSLNEKIQWLKLYDKNPDYYKLVDKDLVKDFVARKLGSEYVIPTLGKWSSPADIDWEKLPERFVLKTTHGGSGDGVIICSEKSSFNREDAVSKLNKAMKIDLYKKVREWAYKDIDRKIIAEQYIEDSKHELTDYKFFCFDGYVDCVMLCTDRRTGDPKFYFFDKDWSLLRYNKRGMDAETGFTLPKPQRIDKMFEIASKLSEGIPFARIDLYNVDGKIYFGEITFYPNSGMDKNLLPEANNRWGKLLNLNNIKK